MFPLTIVFRKNDDPRGTGGLWQPEASERDRLRGLHSSSCHLYSAAVKWRSLSSSTVRVPLSSVDTQHPRGGQFL